MFIVYFLIALRFARTAFRRQFYEFLADAVSTRLEYLRELYASRGVFTEEVISYFLNLILGKDYKRSMKRK